MEKWCLVVICFLSISSICLVRLETIETWGELKNVRAIDHQVVTARWIPLKIQNLTVTIPSPGMFDAPIAAIQHVNYQNKAVKTRIIDGGVGFKYLDINIVSQRGRGINSTITIFTKLDA